MKNKLLIGITTSKREVNVNFSKQEIFYISKAFNDLLKDFDHVIPVFLSSDTDANHSKEIIEKLDGLILSSGEDIDPSIYNAKNLINYDENIKDAGFAHNRPMLCAPNKRRDLFEISLYKAAKEKNIPVLGICRGMQIINVAEGGTLHQEIPTTDISHFIEKDAWIHYHPISVKSDTKLFDIFKTNTYSVSSDHHQAVDKLGENLVASALADDGIIEIVEHEDHNFIMGLQGHIEKITNNFPLYNKVIEAFIEEAHERR